MKTHRGIIILGWILVSFSVEALTRQKVILVGAGDCKDASLLTSVRRFQKLVHPMLKKQLFAPDVVLDIIRPQASRNLADIRRQVDTARTLLFGGQDERGLGLVQQALIELDKTLLATETWSVTRAALLVQSQLYKNLGRMSDMDETFRKVLRIDPQFTLDAAMYPPSTLRAFEKVRKQIARERKGTLEIGSSPPGAIVLVDGRALGKTPLQLSLLPGSYRVLLQSQDRLSFARRVRLTRRAELQVDMDFEGAVSVQLPLCVTTYEDDVVLKLGKSISASQIIILRHMGDEPVYLTSVLYSISGKKERAGSAMRDKMSQLASFIVTGSTRGGVWPVGDEPWNVVGDTQSPTSEPLEMDFRSEMRPARIVSYSLLSVGVASSVAGIIIFAVGAADRNRLTQTLRQADGRLYPPGTSEYMQAQELMPQVDMNRTLAFSFIGAGVGCGIAGGLGLLMFPQAKHPKLVFVPTLHGGAVLAVGNF